MAVQLIHKNSSVEDKRPTAAQLANGEISLNYNAEGAFLSCRDSAGRVQQIGGVKISATAPENPVRQTQWFEPASLTLFIYDGTNWLPIAGGGGGGGGGTGDITTIIGNNGIDASEIAGVVTLNVDLAGGDDGLQFRNGQLTASVATPSVLGSVKIGSGIDVTADGTISVDTDEAGLQPDEIIGGTAISVDAGADSVTINADIATTGALGVVRIGSGIDVAANGTISVDTDDAGLQPDEIIGGDGIDVTAGADNVTVAVDLAGGQDGLETAGGKLKASIASSTTLGSVMVGRGIDVDATGKISVDSDAAGLQPDEVFGGDGIKVTADADGVTIDVDLAPKKGLEFIGDQLAANLGDGLQFNPDGSIEINEDEVFTPSEVIGGDGIKATTGADTVTIDVDLLGGQDGLEIKSDKLTATIATKSVLGSVKVGDNLTVEPDGTIAGNPIVPPVISQDNAPAFVEDYIWFDTSTAEAYVGYKDPSDDEYWVSLTKVGAPGKDGKDGDPVVISQDTAPPFQEDAIWFDTSSGKAYFGYKDQDGDEYWISLTQVGPPGTPGIDGNDGDPVVISQDTAPSFQEDAIWFNTSSGEAFFGYKDPSGDEYWVSLSKPGPPGADGVDGIPVVISQDTAPPVQEDAIWFNTANGEAFFGYVDPSGDAYWVSLSKPGPPGTPGVNGNDGNPVIISQDATPAVQEDSIWFNTSNGEAFFGYVDPSNDKYWVSLSKPGAPGANGLDGTDGPPTYATVSATPPASPSNGEIWVKDTTGKFYAWWDSQSVWVSS